MITPAPITLLDGTTVTPITHPTTAYLTEKFPLGPVTLPPSVKVQFDTIINFLVLTRDLVVEPVSAGRNAIGSVEWMREKHDEESKLIPNAGHFSADRFAEYAADLTREQFDVAQITSWAQQMAAGAALDVMRFGRDTGDHIARTIGELSAAHGSPVLPITTLAAVCHRMLHLLVQQTLLANAPEARFDLAYHVSWSIDTSTGAIAITDHRNPEAEAQKAAEEAEKRIFGSNAPSGN